MKRIYKITATGFQPSFPGADEWDDQELTLDEKCFESSLACAQFVNWFLKLGMDENWVENLSAEIANLYGSLLTYAGETLAAIKERIPCLSAFRRIEVKIEPVEYEVGEFAAPEKHWSEEA